MNSSPIAAKITRHSVKAALRKKDGGLGDVQQPEAPSRVTRPKRKKSLNPSFEGALAEELGCVEPPSKRRKEVPDASSRKLEASPPRPAVPKPRPVKRYGRKKGKSSSPPVSDHHKVEYDRAPGAPPTVVPEVPLRRTKATQPTKVEDTVSARHNSVKESICAKPAAHGTTRTLRNSTNSRASDPVPEEVCSKLIATPITRVEEASDFVDCRVDASMADASCADDDAGIKVQPSAVITAANLASIMFA